MATFENDFFHYGLDAMVSNVEELSLHDDVPTGGSNELEGGTYARQQPTFNPAAGGEVEMDGSETFDVPGGSTVAYVGLWADDEGEIWLGFISLDDVEQFGADGEFTLTSLIITMANESS